MSAPCDPSDNAIHSDEIWERVSREVKRKLRRRRAKRVVVLSVCVLIMVIIVMVLIWYVLNQQAMTNWGNWSIHEYSLFLPTTRIMRFVKLIY